MFPTVPWRSDEDLRQQAEVFLRDYNPEGKLPVDIEGIAEFDLGIKPIIVPGFRQKYGFEAALSVDMTVLWADNDATKGNGRRFRFTVAHEVGHWILHRDQVQSLGGDGTRGWKAAISSIPSQDYSRMEAQAYRLAGFLLVPREPLLQLYLMACGRAEEHGIDLGELGDFTFGYVAGWIAKNHNLFDVSAEVIERQLRIEIP